MERIRKLHAHLIITGLYKYPIPISEIFATYALNSSYLADARKVFDEIDQPNSFFYNVIIRALSHSNTPRKAIIFYNQMRLCGLKQDNLTFPFVIKACSEVIEIRDGRRVHCHALKIGCVHDVFVANALVHLYASCCKLSSAKLVFDEMAVRDLVSWNSLICGYGQHNCLKEVLNLYNIMKQQGVKADKVTMVKVLSACTRLGEWKLAEDVIRYIDENNVEIDVFLGNTLIDYYGRKGSLELAKKVFNEMKQKNIVSMNAIIAACSKAKDLVTARKIFDGISNKDVISWSSMISGYSQANRFNDAITLFREMQLTGIKPDEMVLVSVLSACAHLGALELGKWIHRYIQRNNIKFDTYVGNSLIDIYAKCGCIKVAFDVFKNMVEKDTKTWNSIIVGLATHGFVKEVFSLYNDMLSEGFKPNDVTFIGVFIACTHGGLVDEGFKYFESMSKEFGIEPVMKHYGCIVDLLSKKGELDRAYEFIENMPIKPSPIIWMTLLGACKAHGSIKLAEIVNMKLVEVDRDNSGNYVLLSNIYAGENRWNDAMEVRERMVQIKIEKVTGCSSIEVGNSSLPGSAF